MDNFEKVEAYFNNELNDSEKNDFLSEVESDANLKSEYNFQNEVINGIKEARKAELKAMLNNVPVASLSTASSSLHKILVGGATTLIIGSSFWYYFNSISANNEVKENIIVDVTPLNTIENKPQIIIKESNPVEIPDEASTPSAKTSVKKEKFTVNTPTVPNSDNDFANQSLPEENLDIPNDISRATINLNSKVNVEIKLKKKYGFHYQYLNEKLVLYGSFEEGLFEVIELNTQNKTELYLYYKSNYYFIKDKSGSIVPLKPVINASDKLKLERLNNK